MCYRCEVCRRNVGPGISRIVHQITRRVPRIGGGTREEIAREYSICRGCKAAMALGVSFQRLIRLSGQAVPVFRPAPSVPTMYGRESPADSGSEPLVASAKVRPSVVQPRPDHRSNSRPSK